MVYLHGMLIPFVFLSSQTFLFKVFLVSSLLSTVKYFIPLINYLPLF